MLAMLPTAYFVPLTPSNASTAALAADTWSIAKLLD